MWRGWIRPAQRSMEVRSFPGQTRKESLTVSSATSLGSETVPSTTSDWPCLGPADHCSSLRIQSWPLVPVLPQPPGANLTHRNPWEEVALINLLWRVRPQAFLAFLAQTQAVIGGAWMYLTQPELRVQQPNLPVKFSSSYLQGPALRPAPLGLRARSVGGRACGLCILRHVNLLMISKSKQCTLHPAKPMTTLGPAELGWDSWASKQACNSPP